MRIERRITLQINNSRKSMRRNVFKSSRIIKKTHQTHLAKASRKSHLFLINKQKEKSLLKNKSHQFSKFIQLRKIR